MTTTKNAVVDPTIAAAAVALVQSGGNVVMAMDFLGDEDMGMAGFEGTDKDSFAIPFLQVLQKMSPLVDPDHATYIEGAKAGMFLNTVTRKLYDGKIGLELVPCAYKRTYIQWGANEAGGGFKGEHTPEEVDAMIAKGTIAVQDGKYFLPLPDGSVNEKKSDYFSDTRSHFVVIIDPDTGDTSRAIFPISGTLTKASKMLMTSLQERKVMHGGVKKTPPTFASKVKVTTTAMSNDKGSWSGISFAMGDLIADAELFNESKSFHKSVSGGEIKADHSRSEQAQTGNAAAPRPQEAEGF